MKLPVCALAPASLLTLWAPVCAASIQIGDYDELTNVYRSVTNFNVETVRGMVLVQDDLYSINTHGSMLNVHSRNMSALTVDDEYPETPTVQHSTLNNPISMAHWHDVTTGLDSILVVGGTSHALAFHDALSGNIWEVLTMPAETGDIVVDADNGVAFVSCPGNNTVVQIDLSGPSIAGTISVASQRPRFLFLDEGPTALGSDNAVYVTPELSGNNTTQSNNRALWSAVLGSALASTPRIPLLGVSAEFDTLNLLTNSRVVDLSTIPGVVEGLPDEDLFRVDRLAPGSSDGVAVPVLRGAGTILAAHGRNPATSDYWIVGTDAHNGDITAQTEPLHNGTFATNQLSVATALGTTPGALPSPMPPVDLDTLSNPTFGISAIASPYALEFVPSTGDGIIAGSTSDRLSVLNASRVWLREIALPDGAIPRDILVNGAEDRLFVYCWGTNEILYYDLADVVTPASVNPASPTVHIEMDLGVDPLATFLKEGRALFYDADNSAGGRLTCNTCHPGLGMDNLGWSIKDYPHDHKDVMVTQSLKGIEDTFPYHWRGERDLAEFNVAFRGLLGGSVLDDSPGEDLQRFIEFVFSVQSHANPMQDKRRVLNGSLSTLRQAFIERDNDTGAIPSSLVPNPVVGQDTMDEPATLLDSFSCAQCHQKVHGTVADINFDDVGDIPTNTSMDVAHFRNLFHRTQDLVNVTIGSAKVPMVRGGFGISHDGDHPSPLDFLHNTPFNLGPQAELDLAAFVEQADHGVAPAAHSAWHLSAATPISTWVELVVDVFPQTGTTFQDDHWISLAAVGQHTIMGVPTPQRVRWFYDAAGARFIAHDPTFTFSNGVVGEQSVVDIYNEIVAGRAEMTLMALPPGNALRFALDRDNDGAIWSTEQGAGTNPLNPISNGNLLPDGYAISNPNGDNTNPTLLWWRLDHTTASTAKFVLLYSEPVRVEIDAINGANAVVTTEERYAYSRFDTITVQHLDPSIPDLGQGANYPVGQAGRVPSTYTFEVKMWDYAGLQGSTTITAPTPGSSALIDTKDQIVPLPFPLAAVAGVNQEPAVLMRVIDSFSASSSSTLPNQHLADVRVAARFQSSGLTGAYGPQATSPNGSLSPEDNQVVIAQILFRPGTGMANEIVQRTGAPGGTAPGLVADPARVFDTVNFTGNVTDPMTPGVVTLGRFPMDLPGPFVFSSLTDINGNATFDFTLDRALTASEFIEVNVVAILEKNTNDIAATAGNVAPDIYAPNDFWPLSEISYQMPATPMELRFLLMQ